MCGKLSPMQSSNSAVVSLESPHPAGMPCDRFGQQEGAPTCKPNRLKWCHTDLGANVMRWPRLVAEHRRFGFLAAQ